MSTPDRDWMIEELLTDRTKHGFVEATELRLGLREGLRLEVGLEQGVVEIHGGRRLDSERGTGDDGGKEYLLLCSER